MLWYEFDKNILVSDIYPKETNISFSSDQHSIIRYILDSNGRDALPGQLSPPGPLLGNVLSR
jgi:hypothetical protein